MITSLGQFTQPSGGLQHLGHTQFFIQLAILLLTVCLFVFSLMIICLNLPAIKRAWRVGVKISMVIMFFTLTSFAILFVMMGIERFDALPIGPDAPMRWLKLLFVAVFLGTIAVLQAAWYVLVFSAGVGEWDRAQLPGYALLMRGERAAWSGIRLGALFGIAAGVISTVVWLWVDIRNGPMLSSIEELLEPVDRLAWPYQLGMYSLLVTGPAITEELAFRGLMLGFLLRVSGGRRLWIVASIVTVSLLWALLHIPNTDMPIIKCLQIFLIGLVLCELARRRGVEAAIAGHVMLNISAVAYP